MIVTVDWIEKNYNKFNELYWNGELPKISFKISRSRNTWGFASFRYNYRLSTITPMCITISNYYDSPEDVKLNTLLHEMIHIADYTFNPFHYILNGRRVSGHHYDPHGYWFKKEASRIEKFGWNITKNITKEEEAVSSLSQNTQKLIARKKNIALVGVITGNNGMNFYFKTDIYKVKQIVNETVYNYNFYKLNGMKRIKFYTFKDDNLVNCRSCCTSLRGWFLTRENMMNKLQSIKATEYRYN